MGRRRSTWLLAAVAVLAACSGAERAARNYRDETMDRDEGQGAGEGEGEGESTRGDGGSAGGEAEAEAEAESEPERDVAREPPCGFEACGGELAGVWRHGNVCYGDLRLDGCPDHRVDGRAATWEGTLDLGADGRFRRDLILTGTLVEYWPEACAGVSPDMCALLTDGFGAETCAPAPDGCLCTYLHDAETFESRGEWAAEGTTLTLDPWGGAPVAYQYCASDGRLSLRTEDGVVARLAGSP